MKNNKFRSEQAADLPRRAEEIAREKAARSPEELEVLSPEETRQTLHELRVHQIELTMQNEELRRAQVELDAARARYFDLYDLAPIGYVTLSEQGLTLEANLTAATLLGVTRGALVKQPITRFILKEDQDIYYQHRKQLFETGALQACELRMLKKDGTIFWARLEATVAQDEDGAPACRVFLSDITERKRAEEERAKLEDQLAQAQKMEAIGILAGGIAHDFNNLLMGILGYTTLMLMKTDKSHPFYEMLKIIERQVESGADLTRQLIGFARGGKNEVKPVNANDMIIKTSEIFGRTKKEITIHRKLQEDLDTIEVDRGQIEQVLLNLYVNAWQAMHSGGDLYLETQNAVLEEQYCRPFNTKPGPYVKIQVTDTGVGMDAEIRQRIFEPFFTTKDMGRGTGLGLASVYGIIKNHGGIINVYSEKGYGSTFTLYLPASEKEILAEAMPEQGIIPGHETILIVDDEAMHIESLKKILENLGYMTLTASNGRKTIELYREYRKGIHMVILDMIMPEMNGRETFLRLKEIDAEVKVLVSSGYSIEDEAAKILELGGCGFIQKPFGVLELSQKIRTVLDS